MNNNFFTTKLYYIFKHIALPFLACFAVFSCVKSGENSLTPKWYDSPKQNDSSYIYGVAQGQTMAEATKMSLVDMASRLIVTVSSKTETILQESKFDNNEELRRTISQNIEKITFSNLEVSNSAKIDNTFFVESKVNKNQFILEQKERIRFLKVKIANIDKNSLKTNAINRRVALIEILDAIKELEIKTRIVLGANENANLAEVLALEAKYKSEFEKLSDKIEIYFAPHINSEIRLVVGKYLNKEKIKIVEKYLDNKEQILLRISFTQSEKFIYENHVVNLKINFENIVQNKIIASNSIEVSGSSTIDKKRAFSSAINNLDEEINLNGILKIIGIVK